MMREPEIVAMVMGTFPPGAFVQDVTGVLAGAGLVLRQRRRHHVSEEGFKRISFVTPFVIGPGMPGRSPL